MVTLTPEQSAGSEMNVGEAPLFLLQAHVGTAASRSVESSEPAFESARCAVAGPWLRSAVKRTPQPAGSMLKFGPVVCDSDVHVVVPFARLCRKSVPAANVFPLFVV